MEDEVLVTPETGVEENPAAEDGAPLVQPTEAPEETLAPDAFAKRLAAERQKWEKSYGKYVKAAKALEAAGYDPDTVLKEFSKRSVEELVNQGMDEATAKELVSAREAARRAQQEAAEAKLAAEGIRLSKLYPDYDHDAVLAFAQERADQMGEALSLESAYLLWSRDNQRKEGEQAVLRQIKAAKAKEVDAGAKGSGKLSLEQLDPTSPEFARMVEDVLRGKKVEL